MRDYVNAIEKSGLTIYDTIKEGGELWIPDDSLQDILQTGLLGISLMGMPPRTRSKFVKEKICNSLGYPIPNSFQKTQPRFVGQNFDVYIQKSNNLQIWNEEISPERRYVVIQVLSDKIARIRVINGEELVRYDKTGTLTIKHQATFIPSKYTAELFSSDTENIKNLLTQNPTIAVEDSPVHIPNNFSLYSIEDIFTKLSLIIGAKFKDSGFDQDRSRGAELHKLACKYLGYSDYRDNGQFPDIPHQLLEVKFQTSPTIDLGRVCPNSELILGDITIQERALRYSDIRYALFYGSIANGEVEITHLSVVSGDRFFDRFPQFQGKVVNKKIQLPLPKTFFDL